MSTKDMYDVLPTPNVNYDQVYSRIGHAFYPMAEYNGVNNTTSVYNSSLPQAGDLLMITEKEQRHVTSETIYFTYKAAELTGTTSTTNYGISYALSDYSGIDTTYSGFLTIPTGTRAGKEFMFHDPNDYYIHQITSITGVDPNQTVKIYGLADPGIKFIYGCNTEKMKDLAHDIKRAIWVHPPECLYCSGSGNDPDVDTTTCPDCSGYKYVGKNADKFLLTDRAKDVGVTKRNETTNEFQLRAWAKKWWKIPTKDYIIDYFAYFLNTNTGNLSLTLYTGLEAYWVLSYPASTYEVGDRIPTDSKTIQEMANDLTIAGLSAVVKPYVNFETSGSMALWFPAYVGEVHPTITGKFKLSNDTYSGIFAPETDFDVSLYNNAQRGNLRTSFLVTDNHYNVGEYVQQGVYWYHSGAAGTIVTGDFDMFSGSTRIVDPSTEAGIHTGIFSGVTEAEYLQYSLLRTSW